MARNNKTTPKKTGRRPCSVVGGIFKWIGIVLGTILLGAVLTGLFALGHARTYIQDVIIPQAEDAQATLNTQAYNPSLSSTIYSGDGTELKTLYARENRVWVTYDEIPKYLIDATVAIEDKRFCEHHGVDWKRTAGAVVYMFTGRDVQGGSTLTQQLIKNISDNDDVTVKRKVLEIFSALEFEKTHSKEEILEMYLNYIYLGRQCNGVYTAAHKYFDKEVNELDLAECASLISITNNPSIYDPINHRDNNMKRASTVVIQMYKQDKISEEEELAALAELGYQPDGTTDDDGYKNFTYNADSATISFTLSSQQDNTTATTEVDSWYVDAVINSVRDDLMEKLGINKDAANNMIFSGGLSIYSCFDADAQAKVDEVYSDPDALGGAASQSGQKLQSSITVVDNETGRVVALSGGLGEKTVNRGLVRATQSLRPPGSSIKPISVYAPAIEEGLITPYSAVDDTPFKIDSNGNPWPKNVSRTYSGLTSIYTSVIKSLNTSAVKTLDLLGLQKSYDYMEQRFGITSLTSYYVTSTGEVKSDIDYAPLALGGLTFGVSTMEMAGAYSTFPRDGVFIKPHLYTKVVDSSGNVILENDETGTQAVSSHTAYYMNELLTGVVTQGTGTKAQIPGITVAGKTGTTTNNCDRWFCGYTGKYTAAAWIGYDQQEKLNVSGNGALELWKQVMSRLMEGQEDMPLSHVDANTVSVTYCTKSGDLATGACSAAGCAATGSFLEGDAPTDYCSVHTTVTVCKDAPIGETGKYHLAGEYCPDESKMEMSVLDFKRSDAAASVTVGDSYDMLSWLEDEGKCTLHTADWHAKAELKKQQTLHIPSGSYTKSVGDASFSLGATVVDGAGDPGGELSYVSSNPSVVTVDNNGVVTIVGPGTAQVTVTAAATEFAQSVSGTVTVTVSGSGGDNPGALPPDAGDED